MSKDKVYQYKSTSGLGNWVVRLMYVQIIVSALAVASSYLYIDLLSDLNSGAFATEQAAEDAAMAGDLREGILGLLSSILYFINGILILRWIYLSCNNAWAMGAKGLQYTPFRSIIWYFVPFANLWMPYGAVKEIWQAHKSPENWSEQEGTPLLSMWWCFWLLFAITSNVSLRLSLKAETFEQMTTVSYILLASEVLFIPLCLIFIFIVRGISDLENSPKTEGQPLHSAQAGA